MHCNLRPPNVAPVVLGFNYETHKCKNWPQFGVWGTLVSKWSSSWMCVWSVRNKDVVRALKWKGHLDVEKTKSFARQAVWWWHDRGRRGTYAIWSAHRQQLLPETLIPHRLSSCPFDKFVAYIFTLMKRNYLLVVDYFSKFPFVVELRDKT